MVSTTPRTSPDLVEKLDEGFDMAVGARQVDTHASLARRFGNLAYNRIASWMTGYHIEDLTSGFRAARARHFKNFLYLLPNKFSYPTTITMAFFRSGLPVAYVPIKAADRRGEGQEPHKSVSRRTQVFDYYFKNRRPLLSHALLSSNKRRAFPGRSHLLRIYLYKLGPPHQYEHHTLSVILVYLPDRHPFRANLGTPLQEHRGIEAPCHQKT